MTSNQTTTQNFVLNLIPGTVTGTVTSSTGALLANATVVTSGGSASATTGADGTYSLTLALGTYTLIASCTGYASQLASVTVQSGQNTQQNFALVSIPLSGGLTPQGVLVKVWGLVTYISPDSSYFCINDGSGASDGLGHTGVPVVVSQLATPTQLPAVGSFVAVTGVVGSKQLATGVIGPVVRLRKASDLQTAFD